MKQKEKKTQQFRDPRTKLRAALSTLEKFTSQSIIEPIAHIYRYPKSEPRFRKIIHFAKSFITGAFSEKARKQNEREKGKVEEDIRNAGYRDEFISHMSALVMKKAAMAESAGCAGVVCSGKEVNMIKNAFGKDFVTVTPGIRPAWEGMGRGDQRRVTTPSEAVKNGSDYLVIGRPIRDASDPRAAAIRIAKEINETIVTIQ